VLSVVPTDGVDVNGPPLFWSTVKSVSSRKCLTSSSCDTILVYYVFFLKGFVF